MQLLLTEYLEIESVNLAAQRSSTNTTDSNAPELRLSDYFSKKRPQRRRDKLFKLTVATPPVTGVVSRRQRYPLVCRPHPSLLHAALPALHALCAHLERPGGGECSLRAFISDYVRWGESERLAQSARAQIDAAMRAPAAWRERAPPPGHTSVARSLLYVHIGLRALGRERAAGAERARADRRRHARARRLEGARAAARTHVSSSLLAIRSYRTTCAGARASGWRRARARRSTPPCARPPPGGSARRRPDTRQ
ncbi:unnamed protein product [Euphydryas editha]|uniref:Uncharacterized protein n=1 Tax=Euphydryas editha TaxID=104508 RepID=A0AAU9VC31_EUPED|nr:unnamed protein product [Euphydryas editha]